jgi:hypothetical protein
MRPSFERLRGLRRNELGKIVCTIKGGVGQSGSGMRSFNILWSVPLLGNCRLLAPSISQKCRLHLQYLKISGFQKCRSRNLYTGGIPEYLS